MTRKKIDGSMAHDLIEAAGYLAKLEAEMKNIIWRVCYRDDISAHFSSAKTNCRNLLRSLDGAERAMMVADAEEAEANKSTIRQVK